MKELLELHILQNFAPSNLNRDDTGSPKDCLFGGTRRARISSQAQKRAMRTFVRDNQLLPPEHLAQRSRLFSQTITQELVLLGRDATAAAKLVQVALGALGLKLDDGKTEYLVCLAASEISNISHLIHHNWDELSSIDLSKNASKKALVAAVPGPLRQALENAIQDRGQGGDAVDLALFGRMLADKRAKNQDAACHVAHALSTHRVDKEFDFFTGLDDLLDGSQDGGAGMLGIVEFNSACFYRYIAIDLTLLKTNLQGDRELLQQGLSAFLRAAIQAIPSGKQSTFAAHNPPSFIALRYRQDGPPLNLANAFEKAVVNTSPAGPTSYTNASLAALDSYWSGLDDFYGSPGQTVYWSLEKNIFHQGEALTNLEALIAQVQGWVQG